ncbi:hypothetical protein Tco_1320845 [Tanacetum coccineum]
MKVIMEGSEKLVLLKINDDSFACNIPLGTIFDEFNRLSGIDDDLFTYEVEIPRLSSVPSNKKEGDDSNDGDLDVYEPRQWLNLMYGDHKKVDIKVKEGVISKWLVRSYKKQFDEYIEIKWVTRGIDVDMEYDPSDVEFAKWLASKFYNHMTMDQYTKNALWIYWTRGDDEVDLTNEEFSDLDDENLIDKNKVAKIFRIKTDIFDFETPICKAFKKSNYLLKIDTDLFTHEIPGVKTYEEYKEERAHELNNDQEEPWSENGVPYELVDHICESFRFKNEKTKWPTCSWNNDGFYNGGELPGMVRVGQMTYFQDYEWCELLGNPRQELPVCKVRRFEMIKYSFGPEQEYVSIKEHEYDDLTRANEDACHAYREIFRIMDEGWLVTRAE